MALNPQAQQFLNQVLDTSFMGGFTGARVGHQANTFKGAALGTAATLLATKAIVGTYRYIKPSTPPQLAKDTFHSIKLLNSNLSDLSQKTNLIAYGLAGLAGFHLLDKLISGFSRKSEKAVAQTFTVPEVAYPEPSDWSQQEMPLQ